MNHLSKHFEDARRTLLFSTPLFSERCGIIADLATRRTRGLDSKCVDVIAKIPAAASIEGINTFGGGASHPTLASAAAIGEAVERFSLGVFDRSQHYLASFREMREPSPTVASLSWFLPQQYDAAPDFPFSRLSEDSVVSWRDGWSVRHDAPARVPASLVHLPYQCLPEEALLSYQTSVGTACARTRARALLSSILEIVERDAFTICWESGVPFPRVPDEDTAFARSMLPDGFRFDAFNLTTDLNIPVILAITSTTNESPAIGIGTAADVDGVVTLKRAFFESLAALNSLWLIRHAQRRESEHTISIGARFDAFNSMYEFSSSAGINHIGFLLSEATYAPLNSIADSRDTSNALSAVVDVLCSAEHDIFVVDVTPMTIGQTGLHVVRAVVPTLARPTLGRYARHLGCDRISQVPFKLGYTEEPISAATMLSNWRLQP